MKIQIQSTREYILTKAQLSENDIRALRNKLNLGLTILPLPKPEYILDEGFQAMLIRTLGVKRLQLGTFCRHVVNTITHVTLTGFYNRGEEKGKRDNWFPIIKVYSKQGSWFTYTQDYYGLPLILERCE